MVATRSIATLAVLLSAVAGYDAVVAETALPSLRLSFEVKRPSMAVFGSTSFDVLVTPVVNNATVSFDGLAAFAQDGVSHNLYLVDGVPYYEVVNGTMESTSCLPTALVPSISDVIASIDSATVVSTVETTQDVSCTNGTWLSTTFAGETYVLCSPDADTGEFKIFGEDLNIAVEYLTEDVTISKPTSAPEGCEAVIDDSVELATLGQLYGITLSGSRRVLAEEAASVSLASSSCSCQGTPRPCLFFHGMDVEADGGIVDSYSFFGDIKEHAPCCSSFSFAILNTVDYEWYNDTLQQKACDAAMNVSTGSTDSGSTVINDLIVVAHSMGNNMFAGALATEKCSIGENVDWIALSGPMKGSMGSDFIYEICGSGSGSSDLLAELGGLIGQCPGTTTRRSLVYDGGDYCDAEMSARYAAARTVHEKYVSAGICGTTYSGLLSSEYAGLLAGGLIIPHHSSENDGIVRRNLSVITILTEANMVAARSVATLAMAISALVGFETAAAQSSLPSLRLGFQVKRSTMAVYGASSFDVYVTPVVSGTNVSFDAMTTFVQDGTTHTFYLVDGVPYHEVANSTADSTTCLPTNLIPSASDIVEALASATAVSTVDTTQDISCTNGTWLSTTFADESFVLCTGADAEDGNFTVYGEDLSIAFEYLTEDVTISKPTSAPEGCEAVIDDSVELATLGQLYGITLSGSRRVLAEEAASVSLASSSCSCQGTPRPCLFFHGMDVEADGGIVDSYSFFGDIKEHAPCCSSFSFAILNTVDYEWYNDTLQQKACDAAMNVSTGSTDSGSTVINDLIVVAHSMGNNMFAGALATEKCSIGENVDWIALSGPMKGSMGSDFIYEVCDGGNWAQDLLAELGGLIGQCPGTTTRRSLVYDGGDYCDAEMSARYAAARTVHEKYVSAGICGTTYSGLLSSEYAGLLAGGLIIPHHSSENDGIVEFQSCIGNFDSSSFEADYSSTWYAAALNHADTTFHNGEGLFSKAKKPLKWFECLL
ncbi:hypothetical protein BBJ28_00006833 [Nothophytophthora sp. Chile5]|nr:hypothetical protein BBJ28_00006833 [Nothophytophthora sp. Chile5]